MGYKSCVQAYWRHREQHQHDPEAMKRINAFGFDIAFERICDVLHTSAIATIVINNAIRTAKAAPSGGQANT